MEVVSALLKLSAARKHFGNIPKHRRANIRLAILLVSIFTSVFGVLTTMEKIKKNFLARLGNRRIHFTRFSTLRRSGYLPIEGESGIARFIVEPTNLDFPLFITGITTRDERSAQGQHIGEGKEKAY